MTEAFSDRCRREVHELHDFFAAWYRGEHPEAAFTRVERALAEDFTIVTPDGERIEREPLLAGIREGRGEGTGMGAGREATEGADAGGGDGDTEGDEAFAIDARAVTVADVTEDRCLLTYEEHHEPAGTARASSAWFRSSGTAPNGVAWLFVHETWCPGGAPDSD